MASKVTVPKSQIPIGRVTVAGRDYDVMQHPEFVRFFFDLFTRVGGTQQLTIGELSEYVAELLYSPAAHSSPANQQIDSSLVPVVAPNVAESVDPDARISALEARIQQLATQINDIQQGYQL